MQVATKSPKADRSITVEYDLGNTVAEKVELFGEEVCNSQLGQKLVVSLQAFVRRLLDTGADDTAVETAATAWKPGVATRTKKSLTDKAVDAYGKMSPEEQKKFLQDLKKLQ